MADNALTLVVERLNRGGGGVRIADNSPGWTNSIHIRSESSDRLYKVAQRTTDGSWACSCLGWITSAKRGQRTCKHLQAMLPALNSLPRQPATDAPKAPTKGIGGRR